MGWPNGNTAKLPYGPMTIWPGHGHGQPVSEATRLGPSALRTEPSIGTPALIEHAAGAEKISNRTPGAKIKRQMSSPAETKKNLALGQKKKIFAPGEKKKAGKKKKKKKKK